MIRILAILVAAAIAPIAGAQSYLIQPGDRLEISVLEDPGLNRNVLVRPDGRISLPLAGSIEVGDRTPEDVEALIRRRLADDFVTPPTVTVALGSLATPQDAIVAGDAVSVYVIGAVGNPGRYDIEPSLDILQALAIAGGPGVFAATQRIQVRRRGDLGETVLLFDYDAIEDGLTPAAPIALQDGDVIVVPERGLFE